MKKRIYMSLTSQDSIDRAIKALDDYLDDLHKRTEIFVSRLMDVGIETAMENTGEYAGMIKFEKKLNPSKDGCDGVLIASDGTKIVREWLYYGTTRYAEVSPLLMAEFGSGWLAKVMSTGDYRSNDLGVGQGTFPGQTHAFDRDGWWWRTPDGVKHHSIGETPTYPMYSAMLAMIFEVNAIGKEVFDG